MRQRCSEQLHCRKREKWLRRSLNVVIKKRVGNFVSNFAKVIGRFWSRLKLRKYIPGLLVLCAPRIIYHYVALFPESMEIVALWIKYDYHVLWSQLLTDMV